MDALRQDFRHAWRHLRSDRRFAAVAVLTLGLGLGAATAIYSVVDGVLLRPLPYPEPERLVEVVNGWQEQPDGGFSPAEYFDVRERATSYAHLGMYVRADAVLGGTEDPDLVMAGALSAGVLPALGGEPALGRAFTAEEDARGAAVVLLSDGLWRDRFGASEEILGRAVQLDGNPFTVIGVMSPDFRLPADLGADEPSRLWVPLGLHPDSITSRGSHFLDETVARLAPGVSPERAEAEMDAIVASFTRDHPGEYPPGTRFDARVIPLTDAVLAPVRPPLVALTLGAGLLLLIACANVGGLQLARHRRRRAELAVRAALGAGTGRLARQLFAETLLVFVAGGLLGTVVAAWGVALLTDLAPAGIPRLEGAAVDPGALAFALAAALATGLAFGLPPALGASRGEPHRELGSGGRRQAGSVGGRGSPALVAGQVALALVLLSGAGLLARSFLEVLSVDPGFEPRGVLAADMELPAGRYPEVGEPVEFFRRLEDRLSQSPGVADAGAVTAVPLAGERGDLNFDIEGRATAADERKPWADWQVVTPGYIRAIGMRLLRGRGLLPTDDERAPGAVVINRTMAERYWPGADAIGERLVLGGGTAPGTATVVGIVEDVRQAGLEAAVQPEMYLPHAQFRFWGSGQSVRGMTLVLRAEDPARAGALASLVRRELGAMDPALPVLTSTMDEVRSASIAERRFLLLLLGAFAGTALLLSAVGLYAVLSASVAGRTHEIGVRLAVGATPARAAALVARQAAGVAGVGLALGLAGALAAGRLLEGLLFGVTAADPLTLSSVTAALLLVAAAAAWLPARRAAAVDPLLALRAE